MHTGTELLEQPTKASGWVVSVTAEELCTLGMVLRMRELGTLGELTATASSPRSKERRTRANGPTTLIMAKAYRATLIISSSKVNSKRVSRRVSERKDGQMAVYSTATTLMEKEMDTVSSRGLITKATQATTKMGSLRASAPTDGLMDASSRAIGGIRKYMASGSKTTQMDADTKDSISWTNGKATVST